MCGIVGFICKEDAYKLTVKYRTIFKQMLFVDQLRGTDGTGFYLVNKEGNVEWAKEATTASSFLEEKSVDTSLDKIGWHIRAAVGHNRAASKGKISDENSHPFVEETTILVHNGTIFNQAALNKDVDVDSHAICHAMEAFGIEDTLKKINGAYALAIYKAKDKVLTLTRNKERPLWLGETKDVWFFSSEPWMMFGIAGRNDIKVENMKLLNEDTLYSFDLTDEKSVKLTEKKLEKPISQKKENVSFFPKRKLPALKKETSLLNLATYFQKGDVICFKPERVKNSGGNSNLEGVHWKYPNVKVNAYGMRNKDISDILDMNAQELLTATVYSSWYDSQTNKLILFVNNTTYSEPLWTENGVELNEEQVSKIDTCDSCHQQIGDVETTYYRERENGKIVVLCEECVTARRVKNPLWGAA